MQRVGVVEHALAASFDEKLRRAGLASCSQRRKVMPLVLLTMRSG